MGDEQLTTTLEITVASSFSDRVAVAPNVMFRAIADESVLLDLDHEVYLGLDPVGTRIWIALTTSSSIQEACDQLLGEYEVEPDQLKTDLDAFVQTLLENHLIRTDSSQTQLQSTHE